MEKSILLRRMLAGIPHSFVLPIQQGLLNEYT